MTAAGNTGTASFSYDGTPITAFVEFSTDQAFDLFFDGYVRSNPQPGDVTGFVLSEIDGFGGAEIVRLTDDTNNCTAGSGSLGPTAGACDLIRAADGTNTAATAESATLPIFADLSGGFYRLGIFDSATPEDASIQFNVVESAVIPLPATAFLMIGALAGFGALRRRGA